MERRLTIRIRDLRRAQALTQEELAEALGLSRQSVNAMEAGRCLPSLPVALQIASYFGVPVTHIFLFDNQEDERPLRLQPVSESQSLTEGKEESMSQLTPWSPLREMREMLDGLMDETAALPQTLLAAGPAVNVSQTEDEVTVEMRLPGYRKEDVHLEVGDDFVAVSGEASKEEESNGGAHYFRREFTRSSFSRTVSLPAIVQTDQAHAEMKDGILQITLPKLREEKPKTKKLEIG